MWWMNKDAIFLLDFIQKSRVKLERRHKSLDLTWLKNCSNCKKNTPKRSLEEREEFSEKNWSQMKGRKELIWECDHDRVIKWLTSIIHWELIKMTRGRLTSWFWYAVTAVKMVSGKMKVRCFSIFKSVTGTLLDDGSDRRTKWIRGWYRCIEFNTIWKETQSISHCLFFMFHERSHTKSKNTRNMTTNQRFQHEKESHVFVM